MSEKSKIFAGALVSHLIQTYLNDVHAASYPQAPEQVGGETYVYFSDVYEDLLNMSEVGSSKEDLAERAVTALRHYLDDEHLSGEFARNSSPSAMAAYKHFSARIDVIARLENGEDIQEILEDLKNERRAAGLNQMPDVPSWHGPE